MKGQIIKRMAKRFVPAGLWKVRRKASILKQHRKVADFWNPVIEAYYNGAIKRKYVLKPEKELGTRKVIWQYWGQGVDSGDLPEIIKICFDSVDKHKGDYQVIRLTDATLSEYIVFPDFVRCKLENAQFSRTFFSDLLRVALLSVYGGVWLDATILLTGRLPQKYEEPDFFMFQRSDDEKNRNYWENAFAYYFGWEPEFKVRVLNSIIFAQKGTSLILTLADLLFYFWETQDSIPDYFFFQILFNELITKYRPDENCPIVNDCIPHIIQTKMNGSYDDVSFEEALKLSSMHKMTYFDDAAIARLKLILRLPQSL